MRIALIAASLLAALLVGRWLLFRSDSLEEDVRRAAYAYLRVARDGPAEDEWDLLSKPAKNIYRELFDATRGRASRCELIDFEAWARTIHGPRFESPKALYAAVGAGNAMLDRVGDEAPSILIDENLARVIWEEAGEGIALVREYGRWRYLSQARTHGVLETVELSSGRTISGWVWGDMVEAAAADRLRWQARLPHLRGRVRKNGAFAPPEWELELFVDPRGRARCRGSAIAPEHLHEELFRRAEIRRDLTHYAQPSEVVAVAHLDRDMEWDPLRALLLDLTDGAVRYRHILLPAKIGDDPDPPERYEGVWFDVLTVWPSMIRVESPAFDLLLADLPEAPGGADLVETLKAADEAERAKGVRVRIGRSTPLFRILPALVALGQVKGLRIVLDLREEGAPPAGSGLELNGRPARLVELETELDPRVELEVWRPAR